MKKALSLVLTVILAAAAFTGCSSSSDNITVAVPNDTTNEARALLLLEDLGYIKVKDDAGITATILDIAENPYGIEFKEVEAAQLPNVLKDVDYAVIKFYKLHVTFLLHLHNFLFPHARNGQAYLQKRNPYSSSLGP